MGGTKFPKCEFQDFNGNKWFYSAGMVRINNENIETGTTSLLS